MRMRALIHAVRRPNLEMSRQESGQALTPETAVLVLGKILEELQAESNAQKLEEARDNAGNEMLKMMQHVFPIVMQVQMDVIKEHGFPEGREGIMKFAQALRSLERDDAEVARLHSLVKAYYLPPVSVNATNESSADERISSN